MPQLEKKNTHTCNKPDKPSILQVIGSVLAAFFGVQSKKNKERGFKHGSHKQFIIMGILMTITFIATVILVVQLVLRNTQ